MPVLTILGDVFLALGCALAALAAVLWLLQRRWVRAAGRARGEVIDVVKRGPRATNLVPMIRFRTEDGREITFRGGVGSRPPAHRTGDTVPVLYDRAVPTRAAVDSTLVVMLLPIIFAANALAFLAIGIALALVAAN